MSKRYKWFRIGAGIAAVCLLGAMWLFSSQNGQESGRLSNAVAHFFMRLFGIEDNAKNLNMVDHIVRKTAHFSLFCLLGLSLSFALSVPEKPVRAFWAFPIALLSAVADEYHQSFVTSRSAIWQDSLLDGCGALTGTVIAFLVLLLIRKRALSAPSGHLSQRERQV